MNVETVEGAIVMRDLASAVIQRVDDALARFEQRTKQTEKATQTLSDRLDKVGGRIKQLGSSLSEAGTALSIGITAPLVAASGLALKFATDYETAMTKVSTLSSNSAADVAKMRDQVLSLAPAVGKGPQELAEALLVITSTGMKGAKAMEVLTASAKASAVGLGETKDVARAVTSAVTAYGESNLTATRAAEILFKAVKDGGAEANEFAGTLGRVVGIASQVGVSFEEVTGFIATFTRLGVDAAEATTALRGTMSTFLTPTREAKEALASIGMTVEDVVGKIRKDGLASALSELVVAFKGNDEAIAAVFGNVRALAGVLGTAGSQSETLADIVDHLKQSTNELGSAMDTTSQTAAFGFAQLKAQVEATAIQFGDALAPSFKAVLANSKPLLDSLQGMVETFAKLPAPVQQTVIALAGIAALVGPFLFFAGTLTSGIGSLIGLLGKLAGTAGIGLVITALSDLVTFTAGLGLEGFVLVVTQWGASFAAAAQGGIAVAGAALAALTSPIGLVVAAIGGLLLAVRYLTGSWEFLTAPISAIIDLFSDLYVVISDNVTDALTDLWLAIKDSDWFQTAAKWVQEFSEWLGKAWEAVKNFGASLRGELASGMSSFLVSLQQTYPLLANLVTAVLSVSGGYSEWRKNLDETADHVRAMNAGITRSAALTDDYGESLSETMRKQKDFTGTFNTRDFGVASAGLIGMRMAAEAAGVAVTKTTIATSSFSAELAKAQAQIAGLNAEQRAQIDAGLKMGKNANDIANAFRQMYPGVQLTASAVELYKKSAEGAAESSKKLGEMIKRIDGSQAIKEAEALDAALKGIVSISGLTEEAQAEVYRIMQAGVTVLRANGQGASEMAQRWSAAAAQTKAAGDAMQAVLAEVARAEQEMNRGDVSSADFMAKRLQMEQGLADRLRVIRQVGLSRELAELQIAKEAELRAIEEFAGNNTTITQGMSDQVVAIYQDQAFRILAQSEELQAALQQASFAMPGLGFALSGAQALAKEKPQIAKTFGDFFKNDLGGIIVGALQGGGSVFKSAGSAIFGRLFQASDKAAGIVGGSINTLLTKGASKVGNMFGSVLGPKIGGAIGGALGSVVPVLGNILGGLAGSAVGKLFGKLFGADAKKTKQMREQFIDAAGGVDELRKKAEYAGVSIDKLLSTKKSKTFEAEVKKLEEAFKKAQERVAALQADVSKIMQKGGIIPPDLWKRLMSDKDKAEIKQTMQQIFDVSVDRAAQGFDKIARNFLTLVTGFQSGSSDMKRLLEAIDKSLAGKGKAFAPEFLADVNKQLTVMEPLVEATLGALLAKGLSLPEALAQMGPGLDQINKILQATGISAGGFLGQVLGWQNIIAKNKELFEVLSGVDDMLTGLQNSGFLTQQSFDALAGTVTNAFGTLQAQGVGATDAITMMQPQIQKLWELEEQFGFKVDDATQAMIDQAVAAGKVGEKFKPAQERMADGIDKLVSAFDKFLNALGIETGDATKTAGRQFDDLSAQAQDALNRIPRDIDINVNYRQGPTPSGGPPSDRQPPQLARGGIVTRSLLANVGEAGPEVVVPLDRLDRWIQTVARQPLDVPVPKDLPGMEPKLLREIVRLLGKTPQTGGGRVGTMPSGLEDVLRRIASILPQPVKEPRPIPLPGGDRLGPQPIPLPRWDGKPPRSPAPSTPPPAGSGGTGGGSTTYNITFRITGADPKTLRQTVEEQVWPVLKDMLRRNTRQARTDARSALGIKG